MHYEIRRANSRLATAFLVLVAVCLFAASSASASHWHYVGASNSENGFFDYKWKGWSADLHSTWTYSWHAELAMERGGTCEEDNRRGFSGTSSFTTPSYSNYCDPRVFGSYGCAHIRLHHGTTNSGPLVGEGVACSQRAPAIAAEETWDLAPEEQGSASSPPESVLEAAGVAADGS